MKQFRSTREAMAAYQRGEATLDDVSTAASEIIAAYFARTGRKPPQLLAPDDAPAPFRSQP
jgi:hypothetical protein